MARECGCVAVHRRHGLAPWLNDEILGAEFVPKDSERMKKVVVMNDEYNEEHHSL